MKSVLFALSVLAFTAVPALAEHAPVVCESDGRYRECRIEGVGVATLMRQISDAACIEGQTWGFRDGRIWVDRGCRAQFTLTSRAASVPLDARVVCEAGRDGLTRCAAETGSGVRLVRRISDAGCEFGRDWGYDRDGIWVTNGCRAEFAVASPRFITAATLPSLDARVVCEAGRDGVTRCAADTGAGVRLVRRISDAGCEFNRDWGYDRDGIWVTNGCRAEFAVASTRFITVPTTVATIPGPLDARVVCEASRDGLTRCAADTGAGVRLIRRISDAGCEFSRDWGYDRDGIWVANGCRAEFAVASTRFVTPAVLPAIATQNVLCESNRDGRNHCRADTSFGVLLARQISDSPCLVNRTWGFDENGVWVSQGCRGEFLIGDARVIRTGMISADTRTPRIAPTLICESENNGHKHCRADTRFGVSLLRQISDAKCERNKSWGVDDVGVWVTNGCRAEFILERR